MSKAHAGAPALYQPAPTITPNSKEHTMLDYLAHHWPMLTLLAYTGLCLLGAAWLWGRD